MKIVQLLLLTAPGAEDYKTLSSIHIQENAPNAFSEPK
jgi:hypothetical protein